MGASLKCFDHMSGVGLQKLTGQERLRACRADEFYLARSASEIATFVDD